MKNDQEVRATPKLVQGYSYAVYNIHTHTYSKIKLTFSIEAVHHRLNYVQFVFNGKIDKVGIEKNVIRRSKLLIVFEKQCT